jgi:hypothetical protein
MTVAWGTVATVCYHSRIDAEDYALPSLTSLASNSVSILVTPIVASLASGGGGSTLDAPKGDGTMPPPTTHDPGSTTRNSMNLMCVSPGSFVSLLLSSSRMGGTASAKSLIAHLLLGGGEESMLPPARQRPIAPLLARRQYCMPFTPPGRFSPPICRGSRGTILVVRLMGTCASGRPLCH